jgi:hypothetical protein
MPVKYIVEYIEKQKKEREERERERAEAYWTTSLLYIMY